MTAPSKSVLLLGGTEEAYRLAEKISETGWRCLTSLAGITRNPKIPPGELIKGGFGGAEGISDFLREQNISALIDATHPFAENISRSAIDACEKTRTPLLRLERPAWPIRPGWEVKANVKEAALFFRDKEERIFLTIGRQEADEFHIARSSYFLVRMIDPPESPLKMENHELILMRGPFGVESERRILRDHRIDWLITKNSGGKSGLSKLTAAEEEGVKVCIIDRPRLPECQRVETVGEAAEWLSRL
jgi:precorrin-6A/cobalt-precorrin-6A reductase